MKDLKVEYLYNADGDPTNLDVKGYTKKYKHLIEEQGGFILEERNPKNENIGGIEYCAQFELVRFFDKESRKYLDFNRDKTTYYTWYSIPLEKLIEKQNDSVFLKILLDAYNDSNLAFQLNQKNFCC